MPSRIEAIIQPAHPVEHVGERASDRWLRGCRGATPRFPALICCPTILELLGPVGAANVVTASVGADRVTMSAPVCVHAYCNVSAASGSSPAPLRDTGYVLMVTLVSTGYRRQTCIRTACAEPRRWT